MKNSILILVSLVWILQSCGTQKKASSNGEIIDHNLASFQLNYLKKISNPPHLQIKAKIHTEIDNRSNNASLKLYFKKDEKIWANVSLLGISGARANVTPAGVQAYEILDKTYIDDSFAYFNQILKVDFINFERLNQLLLGQLFLIAPWNEYQLTTEQDSYFLSYKNNEKLTKHPKTGKYIHRFSLDSNYHLKTVEITDPVNQSQIKVSYTDWTEINGNAFPTKINVIVDNNLIELSYNHFKIEEMNPPFRIPKNYKKRNLN